MISTDLAPNEQLKDAWVSFKTLFQPWNWKKGEDLTKVKRKLKPFFPLSSFFLFLTGRASLYQLIQTLNLKKDSDVLVQAFTCEAVVLPIIANGLKPKFIDIETKTLSMDIDDLKKKFAKPAKVLILQHTFALTPFYRKEIIEFAKKNNLFVIEDLAHGFNVDLFKKDKTGTTKILSFGRSKALSSLFGGAVVSQNNAINNKLQLIEKNLPFPSSFFIIKALFYKPLIIFIKSTYDFYLGKILHKFVRSLNLLIPEITTKEKRGEYDYLFNKAYPNALAKLLLVQLNKFEQINEKRHMISEIYKRFLKEKCMDLKFGAKNSLLRFPIFVENRENVIKKYKQKNIYLGRWYDQAIAPRSISLDKFMYRVGECPKAEEICEKIVNLPTNIKVLEANKIIKILNDVEHASKNN